MCGEHPGNWPDVCELRGSSPRVRGTRFRCVPPDRYPGIIPACAGNTRKESLNVLEKRDHPRVCGEHYRHAFSGYHNRGSSPRVRGTPSQRHHGRIGEGIIPACAGNTNRHNRACIAGRDHPRVCGEHAMADVTAVCCSGSSPRVRGTPQQAQHGPVHTRIIPACAGNT